jgi:photosystem II stability/assembly factor-like uncharacterized protein
MTEYPEEINSQEFVYNLVSTGPQGPWFAARSSGLFRSDDWGKTWVDATGSLALPEPVPATVVLVSPDYIHDASVFAGVVGGMLRSPDNGKTWQIAKMPSPPPMISALAISPRYVWDGILLAGTMEDGILSSSDRGSRWVSWNFGLLDLHIFSLAISPDFGEDETVYAGTETGIFRSTNGGRAWREINLPVGFATILSLAISPNFKQDGTLFAGTEEQGLLRSTDRGETWQGMGGERFDGPVNTLMLGAAYAQQPEIVALTNGGACISRDGGATWQNLWEEISADAEITALLAPEGFAPGKPAWLGLVGGDVVQGTF